MSSPLIVYAPRIHHGGGLALLLALLRAIPDDRPAQAIIDRRVEPPATLPANLKIHVLQSGPMGAINAEIRLQAIATERSRTLAFSNSAPLWRTPGKVAVYLQNRYLVDPNASRHLHPGLSRVRLRVKRMAFLACKKNAHAYLVQTRSMQELAAAAGIHAPIHVLPFTDSLQPIANDEANPTTIPATNKTFIYVASAEGHKNHEQLLKAWQILAADGYNPKLILTVNEALFPEVAATIHFLRDHGKLNIENHGTIPRQSVLALLKSADAFIFPSLMESFGLPLLEARQAGLPILAAELDYVRDSVDPVATFDPTSALSISRAVRRFMGAPDSRHEILTPTKFWQRFDEIL